MSYLLLAIIVMVSIFIYKISKSYLKNGYRLLNPINILLLVWNLALIYHAYIFGVNKNVENLYLPILIGLISFAIGFLLTSNTEIVFQRTSLKRSDSSRIESIRYNEKKLIKVLMFTAICELGSIALSLYVMYKLTNGNLMLLVSNSTYVRLMYLSRHEGTLFNLLSVLLSINGRLGYVVLGIYSAKKFKYYRINIIFWTAMEVAGALITMSKMSFFIFLLILGTAFVNSAGSLSVQKKTLRKVIPLAIIVLVVVFVLIGIQRNYQTGDDTMLEFVLKRAGFYFASPLEALSIAVAKMKSEWGLGSNTFRFIYKFFVRINLIEDSSLTNHLAAVSTAYGDTNVYSWFYPFYQDLSYIGFLIYPLFLGILSGLSYTSRESRFGRIAANSYIIAMVAMSFYEFLWSQGTYFYVLIYAFIFDGLFMRKVYECEN